MRALYRVLTADKHYNSPLKTVGTLILLTTWCVSFLGISFEFASRPPFYEVFTGLVFLIVGRWWGIELVWESLYAIDETDPSTRRKDDLHDQIENTQRRDDRESQSDS